MEMSAKSAVAVPANVVYLSSNLGQQGPTALHQCDWKCENELVCGNMYRCNDWIALVAFQWSRFSVALWRLTSRDGVLDSEDMSRYRAAA